MTEPAADPSCPYCRGTGALTPGGILRIYAFSSLFGGLLMLAGVVLAIVLGNAWWLLLSAAGYLLPLVRADLRPLLYPFVSVAALFGKPVNCPRCEPAGGVFRSRVLASQDDDNPSSERKG
jgi:hypothetical protein